VGKCTPFVVLLALLTVLLLTACGPRSEWTDWLDVTIVSVSPDPPSVGDAKLVLEIRDADGNPVNDATIVVEGTMTHAGMQPVIVATEALGEGRYATKGFKFTMGGDWVIIVRATLADGAMAQQRVDLAGVQGEMKMDMKSDKAKESN
jgi:major membrane immunogen (membrane-anchored lipoprotein)